MAVEVRFMCELDVIEPDLYCILIELLIDNHI